MNVQQQRELLELSAKAADYRADHPMNARRLELSPPVAALLVCEQNGDLVNTAWTPFENDGDGLRLAIKLGLLVDIDWDSRDVVVVIPEYHGERIGIVYKQDIAPDSNGAAECRRAIVLAAAAIGQAKVIT